MGRFVRVEADLAGPSALGLLVPPGRRTFVVIRPRSLSLDLLLCRSPDDPSPLQLSSAEAQATVQAVYRLLRDGGRVATMLANEGTSPRITVGPHAFAVCPRAEGKPYAPMAAAPEEAQAAITSLLAVLSPEGEQEAYFNTRFFGDPTSLSASRS